LRNSEMALIENFLDIEPSNVRDLINDFLLCLAFLEILSIRQLCNHQIRKRGQASFLVYMTLAGWQLLDTARLKPCPTGKKH